MSLPVGAAGSTGNPEAGGHLAVTEAGERFYSTGDN